MSLLLMAARARKNHISGSSDPFWTSVVALLHFDGTNGSTSIIDQKGHTWTCSGSAALDTSKSAFGTASFLANGGAVSSTSSDYNFGTGDFTIEGWRQLDSAPTGFSGIFDTRSSGGNIGRALYDNEVSGNTNIATASNSAFDGSSPNPIPDFTHFFHWAIVRSSGVIIICDNGIASTGPADTRTYASTPTIIIGNDNSFADPKNGRIDEVRITAGVARYTVGSYTVPTAAFPNS